MTDFVQRHDQVFVVEMNRDGQMAQLLTLEYPLHAPALRSVAYEDGLPAAASWVLEGILAQRAASTSAGKAAKGNGRRARAAQAPASRRRKPTARKVRAKSLPKRKSK